MPSGHVAADDDLPFIDAHEKTVRAPPDAVWDAAADVVSHWGGPLWSVAARLFGCTDVRSDFPHAVVGFRVARAERPTLLSLRGEHRFSSYSLKFSTQGRTSPGTPSRIEWIGG